MLFTGIYSCQEKYPLYESPDNRVYFTFENESDTLINYTFVYNNYTVDTIWLNVQLLGFLSESPRSITLEQINTIENNAIPGKHFIALTDASYSKFHQIGPNTTVAKIPIFLLRDATLEDKAFNLKLRIKENEYFKLGIPTKCEILITTTNQLVRPTNWGAGDGLMDNYMNLIYGVYGKVKHKFMIDVTGEKFDDKYISEKLGFTKGFPNSYFDEGYAMFLLSFLKNKLIDLNAVRATQGLGPLAEKDGRLVTWGAI